MQQAGKLSSRRWRVPALHSTYNGASPQRAGLFFPPLKRLFLLPAFVCLVVHMASQVYSRGLKGAIVTLSSLESVEWRQWHPSELHGAITLTGGSPERPGEVT